MEGGIVWDGTLSSDDFYVSAKELAERWKQITPMMPQWTWIPFRPITLGASCNDEGYLSLEGIYHHIWNEVCHQNSSDHTDEAIIFEEEPVDIATLVESYDDARHIYDFHIVYNFSYKVPVLYFRGYRSDGQSLKMDEIEKDLPCYSLSILRESRWTYMTQEEHPILHRPWFMLHPCGTSDWMKLLFHGTIMKNPDILHYLLSWLSVVGQAVGLKVPLELQSKSISESLQCDLSSR